MKIRKTRKMICLSLLLAQVSLLSGCSLSFCGFPLGGKQEMVFTCEEDFASEAPDTKSRETSGVDGSSGGTQEEPPDAVKGEALTDGKVDLNSAGPEELMNLNGIGETRAKAILEYREKNGPFARKEDIMQVPGIKEGIYSKIQDQIVVR